MDRIWTNEETEYTSASIADSQNVFENATKNAATQPTTQAMTSSLVVRSPFRACALRMKRTATKKVNRTAIADASEDRKLTCHSTLPNGIIANSRPIRTYRGVPGGCGIPKRCDVAMNSPESQNGIEGVTVIA